MTTDQPKEFKCENCHAVLGTILQGQLKVGTAIIKTPTPLTCLACGTVRVWRCVLRFQPAMLTS